MIGNALITVGSIIAAIWVVAILGAFLLKR